MAEHQDERRRRAEESVASRFTRPMNAASSPLGVCSDPPLVAAGAAVTITISLLVARFADVSLPGWVLWAFALLPVAVGVGTTALISGARAKVVDWLAGVPFPIENVNGLLAGVGQNLHVRFSDSCPSMDELDQALRQVHQDCFALEFHEEEPEAEVRIGVLDSKLNPARANYRRFRRVQSIVERALVPLSERYPIEHVRVC